jgi:hypothetical protein
MPKVKLNLKSLSASEKVDKAHLIVKALTGNSSFTTPQPALATVTTAANEVISGEPNIPSGFTEMIRGIMTAKRYGF